VREKANQSAKREGEEDEIGHPAEGSSRRLKNEKNAEERDHDSFRPLGRASAEKDGENRKQGDEETAGPLRGRDTVHDALMVLGHIAHQRLMVWD
jgi:hypothetical protein